MKFLAQIVLLAAALSSGACVSLPWARAKDPVKAGASKDRFSGRWEGKWISAKHRNSSGKLKCQLKRIDSQHYEANFKAYWLALHGNYQVILNTQEHGNRLIFEGSHSLSKAFGGAYHYEGSATPKKFTSSYSSEYDFGRFEMKRVH